MKKLIYLLIFISFQNSFSQIYEAGFTLNMPNILTDNSTTMDLLKPKISPTSIGFAIKKNANPRIAYRLTANRLKHDNISILEGTLGVDFNFSKYNLLRFREGERGTPYFILEAAALIYNNGAGYKPMIALPVGIGYKRAINRDFLFSLEAKGRVALTDDLDGMATNGSTYDAYYFLGGSIYYTFGWPKDYKTRSKF
ncbi:DUF6089 family protein [Ochrovirga pacifica]|uniref:DUF6089 family protein n=1 Tax=Ochrovirga pacifica TaxID=1042376 RepID=UPI00025591BF|nr:DUF6089 family protein [Ochrovirga pacifica]